MAVKVFTAGDDPGEVEDLVSRLLTRAGYTKYDWECRLDNLEPSSGELRPIRVIGFKSYGVILRVKPYASAISEFQMTLHIPQGSGYSAKNLFEQLRVNEKSVSRAVRKEEQERKQMETITPAPSPVEVVPEEYRPEFSTLQAIIKNRDKLKYVLEKVQKVVGFNFCRNKVQFTESFRHECKWDKEGHSKGAVGRVLTELVKSDYIMETVNDRDAIIGYTLTEKGNFFITNHKDDQPITPPAPVKKEVEAKVDIPTVLIGLRVKLQELADVANKIVSNNAQKAEYRQKIEQIDKENEELSKILDPNRENVDLLNRLGQNILPLPLQGVRQ